MWRDRLEQERALAQGRSRLTLTGYCACCERQAAFEVDCDFSVSGGPNWRETLRCPRCKLNNRMRAAFELIRATLETSTHERTIYLTERFSPFYRAVRARYPNVTGSEFTPERRRLRFLNALQRVRKEDVTQLSFSNAALDLVCTADVLEHVPDYTRALAEFFRCLRPGGTLLLTVPFLITAEHTVQRARMRDDGTVEHLEPPEYHRASYKDPGVLCFYHFGWDLLDRLREAGFAQAEVAIYWSPERGHLGGLQSIIQARKSR